MTCDELSQDYGPYAIGALDGEELDELRAHLGRGCQNCTPGVREAEAVVAQMAAAVKLVDPPKRLRTRVVALVNPDSAKPRIGRLWILAAAFSLFAAAYLAVQLRQTRGELASLSGETTRSRAEVARLNETLSLLEDPAAREVTFGKGARGRIVISPNRGVAFSGQNLAALPSGKTYEMWIIPKAGKPVPAGIFTPSPDGVALHIQSGPVDLATTAAVAVSIENAGGVQSPTADQIIIVAPVGQ